MTAGRIDRRQLLKSLAATGVVATAGCLSSGGDSTPEYAEWVPAGDEGVPFAYLKFDITEETDDDSSELLPFLLPTPAGSGDGGEQPVELPDDSLDGRDDPLLLLLLKLTGGLSTGAGFAFWTAGLGNLIERGQPEMIDEMFVVDRTTMGVGEFDTDELDQRLRTDEGPNGFSPTYEFLDESESFQFYELPETAEGNAPATVAVSQGKVLLGPDRDGIERVAETVAGERERAVDALEEFDWLTETVGEATLLTGWHGSIDFSRLFGASESQRFGELFTQDDDMVIGMSVTPETNELTVDLAVHNDSLSPDRRDAFETMLGTAGTETTVSLDDGQFSASGTYDEIPFKPVVDDWTDSLPSGDDLPAKITEAVPDGAIEFTEDPDEEGVYRVKPVKEMQVDELTVRAINAGWEISLDNPNSPRWVAAYPNPDDDEIRVVVTVDDVSGIIATKEIP